MQGLDLSVYGVSEILNADIIKKKSECMTLLLEIFFFGSCVNA